MSKSEMNSPSTGKEQWIANLGRVKQYLMQKWGNLIQVILGIGSVVACIVLLNYAKNVINHVPVINGQFMNRDDVILMNGDIENASLGVFVLAIPAGILLAVGIRGLLRK
jgi:hypothetical protein